MLSKFVKEGDRIELVTVDKRLVRLDDVEEKIYLSKIYEITSEDTMEILMPMEKTKLILLPVDAEFNMFIYTDIGPFQCFVRIVDRYKSNNMYILAVELTSNLRKYQRREFYRFSCVLEMCARNLEEEEIHAIEEKSPYVLQPNLPIKRSVIVDISGGGLRFISDQKYEPGSLIYCSYNLVKHNTQKRYEVVGKVLAVKELENRSGTYEHRVQYYNMDDKTREEIIKFIFDEERKSRKFRKRDNI